MGKNTEKNTSRLSDLSPTLTKNGRIATMCKAEIINSQSASKTQGDVLYEKKGICSYPGRWPRDQNG